MDEDFCWRGTRASLGRGYGQHGRTWTGKDENGIEMVVGVPLNFAWYRFVPLNTAWGKNDSFNAETPTKMTHAK
jgi:hypothetical protein